MKKIRRSLLRAAILWACTGVMHPLQAQTNKDAEEYYKVGIELTESYFYDSADGKFDAALKLELKAKKPDTAFLAKLYQYRGSNQKKRSNPDYIEAVSDLRTSYFLALNKKDEETAGKALIAFMDASNRANRHNLRTNLTLSVNEPVRDTVIRATRFIEDIVWRRRTKVRLKIHGGKNDGIVKGGKVNVMATYYNERNPLRQLYYIASGTVDSVGNGFSWSTVEYNSKEFKDTVFSGDAAILDIQIPRTVYKGDLYYLAKDGVFFKDISSKNLMYHQTAILNNSDPGIDSRMYRLMVDNIKTVYDWIKDDTSRQYNEKIADGRFKGHTIISLLNEGNATDVQQFLLFVKAFPGKYIHKDYSFPEVFATWGLNKTPMEGVETVLPRVLDTMNFRWPGYRFYFDSSENVWSTIRTIIGARFDGGMRQESIRLAEKLLGYFKMIRNSELEGQCITQLALLELNEKNDEKAIQYCNRLLDMDYNTATAYWYRALALNDMKRLEEAMTDYDSVIVRAPYFDGAYGNKGWALLSLYRYEEAEPFVNQAYELDSSSMSWCINKGHLHLFKEQPGIADYYYRRCIDNITSESEFYRGPIGDFNLFISKGWKKEVSKQKIEQFKKEFYRYRIFQVKADSLEKLASALDDVEAFVPAVSFYQQAIEEEIKGPQPRLEKLRLYQRSIGYNWYKMGRKAREALDPAKEKEMFTKSLAGYERALAISRNMQENESKFKQDLKDCETVSDWLSDTLRENIYTDLRNAYERYIQEKAGNSSLYLVAVGVNGKDFRYADQDAACFADLFEKNAGKVFDSVFVRPLIGNKAGKANLLNELSDIVHKSKPNDAVIFYYSGITSHSRQGFVFENGEFLSNEEVINRLDEAQANKVMVMLDAPHNNFINSLMQLVENSGTSNTKSYFMLSPGLSRIENDSNHQGWLTSGMIQTLKNGISPTGYLTAKSLIGGTMSYLVQNGQYLNINDYSSGADFNAFPANYPNCGFAFKDTLGPDIQYFNDGLTRGAGIEETDEKGNAVIKGRVWDPSGVAWVEVNGTRAIVEQTGKFSVNVKLSENDRQLHITAMDKLNNLNERYFDFVLDKKDKGSGSGNRYAVLFGTDNYDSWDDLNNPVRDVNAIGQVLKEKYSFNINIVRNAKLDRILEVLDSLQNKAEFGPYDQLLVMFAGHGQYDQQKGGFLVASESKKPENDPFYRTYLRFKDISESLNGIRNCKNIFLILDVCFGGGFFDQREAPPLRLEGSSRDIDNLYKQNLENGCRKFLTSADLTYAFDGAGEHSPFTNCLLNALNSASTEKSYLVINDIVQFMTPSDGMKTIPKYGRFGDDNGIGQFILKYMPAIDFKPKAAKF